MSGLVFLDCETTGLDPDRHEIWEIALIFLGGEDGDEWVETVWQLPVDLTRADPTGLRISGYYTRHRAAGSPVWNDVAWIAEPPDAPMHAWREVLPAYVANEVAAFLDGAHLVGAVPSFDAAFLTRWLNAHGQAATWHYHLIDVEALAVGYLHGIAAAKCDPLVDAHEDFLPSGEPLWLPWKSDDLSRACGVEPPGDDERHTALGDARWAKRLYEAITGGVA